MQIDSVMYKKNYYKSASLIFDKKIAFGSFLQLLSAVRSFKMIKAW